MMTGMIRISTQTTLGKSNKLAWILNITPYSKLIPELATPHVVNTSKTLINKFKDK